MNTSVIPDRPVAPALSRKTIVVGYDGSASALAAFEHGVHLAQILGTDLLLVATWSFPRVTSVSGFGGWSPEEDARGMVQDAIVTVFPSGAPPWFRSDVVEGPAAKILIEQSRGAEMLIVGSRGHGGFAGLLLGSVSSACAEHATCPVLVLHDEPAATVEAPSAVVP